MKLETGHPTVKHAAIIAVLAVVLYAVFPGSSATTTDVPVTSGTAESATTDSGAVSGGSSMEQMPVAVPNGAVSPEVGVGLSETNVAHNHAIREDSDGVAAVSELPQVTEELIQEIITDNLFVAVMPAQTVPVEPVAQPQQVEEIPKVSPVPKVSPEESRAASMAAETKVSVLYSSSRGSSFAVVNGAVVKPGDVTDSGLQIESITPDGIVVRTAADTSLP
jgi:hypothetical protein